MANIAGKAGQLIDNHVGNNATGYIVGAGVVTFLARFKETGGYPDDTPKIFLGTAVLAIGAAFFEKSPLGEPIKWLAIIMLLVAILRWVPTLSNNKKKVK